jgi:hypothetical protein
MVHINELPDELLAHIFATKITQGSGSQTMRVWMNLMIGNTGIIQKGSIDGYPKSLLLAECKYAEGGLRLLWAFLTCI